jgi:hypothetical protein
MYWLKYLSSGRGCELIGKPLEDMGDRDKRLTDGKEILAEILSPVF